MTILARHLSTALYQALFTCFTFLTSSRLPLNVAPFSAIR